MSNKPILKKTSGLLIVVMMLSMLIPVLASAAVSFNGTFSHTGTVSGQISFDGAVGDAVYGQSDVTLSVYGTNGEHAGVVTVTYASYSDGVSYYNIPSGTVIGSVYNAVYFQYDDNNVTDVVYRQSAPPTGCTYCGGGGGGGGPLPGSTITAFNGTVGVNELKQALSSYSEVTIQVSGDAVSIPVAGLLDASEDRVIIIVTDNGAYTLPLDAFDFDALAQQVETDVEDLKLNVSVKELDETEAQEVNNAITALGGNALSKAVDFSLSVEGDNDAEVAIDSFDRYIKRKLPVDTEKTKTATVALFNPDTKTLSFVPSLVSSTEAEFWRTSNSIYTVIELDRTFGDIVSHWGQDYIELLASKLIIDGVTDTTFEPERNITRAEFAALVVRSLGLSPETTGSSFNDITSDAWYAGVVNAAAKAGIVDGYEDGSFRPQAQITREELAAMVVRSFEYAGGEVEVDDAAQTQILSAWSDASQIVWGHLEVAKAIKAGLVDGMTDTTLQTYAQATRAQTAAMLQRFLEKVNFID